MGRSSPVHQLPLIEHELETVKSTDHCAIECFFWGWRPLMIAWPGRIMIRPAEPRMRNSETQEHPIPRSFSAVPERVVRQP